MIDKHQIKHWKELYTDSDVSKVELLKSIAAYFASSNSESTFHKLYLILCGVLDIKNAAGYLPPLIREYLRQIKDQLIDAIEEYGDIDDREQVLEFIK